MVEKKNQKRNNISVSFYTVEMHTEQKKKSGQTDFKLWKKNKLWKHLGWLLQLVMFIKHVGTGGDVHTVHFWQLRNHVQNCNFYEMVSVYESLGSGEVDSSVAGATSGKVALRMQCFVLNWFVLFFCFWFYSKRLNLFLVRLVLDWWGGRLPHQMHWGFTVQDAVQPCGSLCFILISRHVLSPYPLKQRVCVCVFA